MQAISTSPERAAETRPAVHPSSMHALLGFVELALVLFSGWTLVFQICLFARVPSLFAYPLFLCVGVAGLLLARPTVLSLLRTARWTPRVTTCTLLMAAGLTLFSLVANRPHVEDALLFHRTIVQTERLDEPFIMHNTLVNDPSIRMTGMFAMTSYEMGMALLGKAVGGDPLWFCQHTGQVVASFLLPLVYVLLFHRFGVHGMWAVASTLLVLVFLLLDGNEGMSYGHFAFTHLKMGKAILFTLLVPATLLYTLRFLNRPSVQRLGRIVLCGVCGVGLSTSAIFLLPVLIFVTSASYVLSFGLSRRRLQRACLANLGSGYCVLIAGLIQSGLISSPHDTSIWDNFINRPSWWDNLFYILEDRSTLTRNAVILLLPLVALRFPWRRYLLVYSIVAVAVFANPLSGPIAIELLTAGAYHRLLYILPIPFCFGLLANCVPRTSAEWRSLRGVVPLAAALVAAALSLGKVVFDWLRQLLPRLMSNASAKVVLDGWDLSPFRSRLQQVSACVWNLRGIGFSLAGRLALASLVVVGVGNAFERSVLELGGLKPISAYSLPPRTREVCKDIAESIPQSANVLAPRDVLAVLALLRPDLRFESEGWAKTLHTFRNNGRGEEGAQRARALTLVTRPEDRGVTIGHRRTPAVDAVLGHGVEYVILDRSRLDLWKWELSEREVPYDELAQQDRMVLLRIRRNAASADPDTVDGGGV